MEERKEKVMIVEDDPISMEFVLCSLKELGFIKVYKAQDGSDALSVLGWAGVDLVISDWNMPKMGGLELYKNIKRDPKLKNIPFMLMTSSSEKEKVIEVLKAGITNFIVKPFELEVLQAKISAILK
jgi:two-component system chemotaxis response regulator CheY